MNEQMTETKLHPIFDDCKAKEKSCRYALDQVCWHKGHVCATDGRILAVQPFAENPLPPSDAAFPEVLSVLEGDFGKPVPLPEPPQPVSQPCKECGGNWKDGLRECPECLGSGEIECCECGQDTDCDECDGDGKIKCDRCEFCTEGVQEVDSPLGMYVGNCIFAKPYLRILWKHGVREVQLSKGTGPLKFVLGDIEGRLMPRTSLDTPGAQP